MNVISCQLDTERLKSVLETESKDGHTSKSSSSTYPFLPKHQACIHACGYTVNQW
jgi:hypothetical protein